MSVIHVFLLFFAPIFISQMDVFGCLSVPHRSIPSSVAMRPIPSLIDEFIARNNMKILPEIDLKAPLNLRT